MYCEELKAQNLDSMKSESAYAHESLDKAIDLSYNDLSDDLKWKLRSLSVFPMDQPISDLVRGWFS